MYQLCYYGYIITPTFRASYYLINMYHFNVRPRMALQLAYLCYIYGSYARGPTECQTVYQM